jgi:hypothetical protein
MSDRRPIWRCVGFVLLLIGCGQQGDRQRLEGTVTLDGAPLAEGQITFLPQSGTKGPTAGGQIAEGYFSIPHEGGTFTGAFLVKITATRKTGKQVMNYALNEMIDEIEQFLPLRYNRQSELTREVTASGPNQFEFALKSP